MLGELDCVDDSKLLSAQGEDGEDVLTNAAKLSLTTVSGLK
jgi:hypothetical protein